MRHTASEFNNFLCFEDITEGLVPCFSLFYAQQSHELVEVFVHQLLHPEEYAHPFVHGGVCPCRKSLSGSSDGGIEFIRQACGHFGDDFSRGGIEGISINGSPGWFPFSGNKIVEAPQFALSLGIRSVNCRVIPVLRGMRHGCLLRTQVVKYSEGSP